MPWHIGIDEAGYGPNLGPLLQSAVGVQRSAEVGDLWLLLADAVRRHGKGRDSRLTIDDSKKVYGSGHNLKALEIPVLAVLMPPGSEWPRPLSEFLQRV